MGKESLLSYKKMKPIPSLFFTLLFMLFISCGTTGTPKEDRPSTTKESSQDTKNHSNKGANLPKKISESNSEESNTQKNPKSEKIEKNEQKDEKEKPSKPNEAEKSRKEDFPIPLIPHIAIEPKLWPGDVIHIEVVGESELTGDFTVPNNGIVSYPLIREIDIKGKNIKEITQELNKRLSSYLRDPIINVTPVKLIERKVYIYGSQKGSEAVSLPLNELTTATRAIINSGVPEDADLSQIFLVRKKADGNKEVIKIPFESIIENYTFEQDVVLQPGDIIVIKKAAKVFIQGNVTKPGSYPIQKGQTMTLWSLILMALGVTTDADLDHVKIFRETEGNLRELIVVSVSLEEKDKKPIILKSNDIVIIPSKSKYESEEDFVTIYGEIRNPGSRPITKKGMRISTLIARSGGLTEYASNTISVFRYLPDGSTQKYSLNFKDIKTGDREQDIELQPGDVIYIDSSIW